jgi:hypothetical protein
MWLAIRSCGRYQAAKSRVLRPSECDLRNCYGGKAEDHLGRCSHVIVHRFEVLSIRLLKRKKRPFRNINQMRIDHSISEFTDRVEGHSDC